MPRILLVKTSSLGDVVHNLPVASDIAAMLPGAEIDWAVEEAFAPIPRLHRNIRRVIPAAVRRWRTTLWQSDTRAQIQAFLGALRARDYDAVIDTQGLFKSAFITRAARGTRYGLDWRSSREPLFLFYDRTFSVPQGQHAVERNRGLAAQSLAYAYSTDRPVEYGITPPKQSFDWLRDWHYAVLMHGSSAQAKLWPEDRWIALAKTPALRKCRVVLPWGSDQERERSERLASAIESAVVPPRLDVAEIAALLADARCVVGVDTGLTHLAGALGTPTVGIYMATHIERHGLYGCARAVSVGGPGAVPAVADVERALEQLQR